MPGSPATPNAAPPAPAPKKPESQKNPVERLYDKIPLTYKQVDMIVKVLIAILAIVLIIGVATGRGIGN